MASGSGVFFFFFSSRRRHTRFDCDWSSDVCSSDLVRLTSRRNAMVSSCRISKRVARGQVFVPFHFREAAANLLTNPVLDPYAKMAELKCCAVRLEAAHVAVAD